MKKPAIFFLLAATFFPMTVFAGSNEKAGVTTKVPTFEQADTNGDHVVTIREAVAAGVPESIAKKDDYNNDGRLTNTDWMLIRYDIQHESKTAAKKNGGGH